MRVLLRIALQTVGTPSAGSASQLRERVAQCSPSMACAVVMLVSSSACARLCPGPLAGDGPLALAGRLPRPGGGCVPMPCIMVMLTISKQYSSVRQCRDVCGEPQPRHPYRRHRASVEPSSAWGRLCPGAERFADTARCMQPNPAINHYGAEHGSDTRRTAHSQAVSSEFKPKLLGQGRDIDSFITCMPKPPPSCCGSHCVAMLPAMSPPPASRLLELEPLSKEYGGRSISLHSAASRYELRHLCVQSFSSVSQTNAGKPS